MNSVLFRILKFAIVFGILSVLVILLTELTGVHFVWPWQKNTFVARIEIDRMYQSLAKYYDSHGNQWPSDNTAPPAEVINSFPNGIARYYAHVPKEMDAPSIDPWGHAYQLVILNSTNTITEVIIWSCGPNAKFAGSIRDGIVSHFKFETNR
jgi:hypothetical protein